MRHKTARNQDSMQKTSIYQSILDAKSRGKKQIAVLIDPDKAASAHLARLLEWTAQANVDFFFVGGSLILRDQLNDCLTYLKAHANTPCILFPGSVLQINSKADSILLLVLISGRNPEFLIGQQVIAAPYLKESKLETIATGYMLIEGGNPTTVSYISNTTPIPHNKPDIAACTAMAGEMLGLKVIYMDAGSGATTPISETMIQMVRQTIDIPLIIGGGIRTPEKAYANIKAGADIIVIGNVLEKDPERIMDIAAAVHSFGETTESSPKVN